MIQALPLPPEPEKEFGYTSRDFERVRQMIHARCGISLSPSKCEMVYSRLARQLRAHNLSAFAQYLDMLEAEPADSSEWQTFTNALTTNLTSFFREPHHFPILDEHLRTLGRRQITIWCCAASTGEEPYSIAMTVCEHFGTFDPPVRILATDIDTNVLDTAAKGVYPFERVEKIPKERLKRFFMRGSGANAGSVKVREELRKLIVFRPMNLLDDAWSVRGPIDAIFCRNVMIYFDRETQRKILEKFVPVMNGPALLFAGHSENFGYASDLFKLRGKTVYELSPQARNTARAAARKVGR